MRVTYLAEANDLRIDLDERAGPSEEFVEVGRSDGTITLDFNAEGQLYSISVIGSIEKLVPPEFLRRYADPADADIANPS